MSGITPTEVGSFFISLIVPIATGVVAASFTTYLALKRFYREKWWEKKHSAYSQVIDNLFEVKEIYEYASIFYEHEWSASEGVSHWSNEGKVDWDKFHKTKAKIQRQYVLSPISLSSNSKNLLKFFFEADLEAERKVVEDGEYDFKVYEEMSRHIEKIIDAIVIDAEKELKFK
ncbi:TPA: hypothetical protein RFN17_001788 [Klebsiella aerogenes]|nr:hypothetical protein [Klebsiella aerogenes]